jgi:hypothetical protein
MAAATSKEQQKHSEKEPTLANKALRLGALALLGIVGFDFLKHL